MQYQNRKSDRWLVVEDSGSLSFPPLLCYKIENGLIVNLVGKMQI